MVVGKLRPATVTVDLAAIRHNVKEEIKRLDGRSELFAVVKADGYGHGAVPVARACRAAGATGFCVALLDEALELRAAHFTEPILVLGITPANEAAIAAANDVSLTFGTLEWLQAAAENLTAHANTPLKAHIALDTGMGRIGFREEADLRAACDYLTAHQDTFITEGIFTHFATADERDTTYFKQQAKRFNELVAVLPSRPKYVHVSNSATSLWHAACNGNMVRFGVAIYGLNPSGRGIPELPYPLQPALSLTSELTFVKMLHKGDAVSYGATYHAAGDEWIGTVPLGYADGWLRRLQGFHVLVNGQPCEIVGRICMDQFMIRLPEQLPVGTTVTLVGEDHGATVSMQDVADYSHTIHYELCCILTQRLPRRYINE
ncbi:alanine racemase [Schleiferilactobacillus harbinensis]|uniref:alanine racemase n=1 Tax=Schleiferilactobacillus harbinensis TaxID=304207 RepID=UPI0021A53A74|nr:alanine racemase [Schleiferilactobacillus harbinensis]MCT2908377.1 alanine racemase [Schleiferilactobacillus harbinensis]